MLRDNSATLRNFMSAVLTLLIAAQAGVRAEEVPGKDVQPRPKSRLWGDSTGVYVVNAEFVELKGSDVILKDIGGNMLSITFDRLRADDQKYVQDENARRATKRTRREMFAELYVELNRNGEQVRDLQVRYLEVLQQLLSARGRRFGVPQAQQVKLLQPYGETVKERTSIEEELDDVLVECGPLGERFVWLSDPFDRMRLGADESTIEALKAAIAAQTGRSPLPFLHLALGFERLRAHHDKEAEADFRTAMELANTFYPRYVPMCAASQALFLDRRNQVRKSRDLFAMAAKSTSDPGLIQLFCAHALMARGDHQRALHDLKAALKTSPDSPLLHEAMARLLVTHPKAAMRNPAEAIEHARKACELADEPTWALFDTQALALAAAGHFSPAVESERKAMELAPAEASAMVQQHIDDYQRKVFRGTDAPPKAKR